MMPKKPTDRWRMVDALCVACGFDQVMLFDEIVVCASCFSRICVLCGCVEERACDDGCSWMYPGICSTHDGDVRLARLAIPSTAKSTIGLLN
jgi:hypothetical protein